MKLDIDELFALFLPDFKNGKLFWLPRMPDMFQDGKYTKERLCNTWNAKLANKEAFTSSDVNGYKVGKIFSQRPSPCSTVL